MITESLAEFKHLIQNYQPSQDVIDLLQKTNTVILVSPTSVGKNTISTQLVKTGKYLRVITDTTRPARAENGVLEKNGDHYWFLTKQQFLANLKNGRYIEAAVVHQNHLYGSSNEEFKRIANQNKTAIFDIDIDGCDHIKKYSPKALAFFILPPSFDGWMERLSCRGQMSDQLKNLRLMTAVQEISFALNKPYFTFFINDNLDMVTKKIDEFVASGSQDESYQQQARQLAKQLILDIQKHLEK